MAPTRLRELCKLSDGGPPHPDPGQCHANRCRAADTIEAQQQTIDLLRRAMHADAERLRHAADRVRVTYVGCDTADALADRIEELCRGDA